MPVIVQIDAVNAVDALDIAVISRRGVAECTLTLSTGQQVPGTLTPADAVAAFDSEAGLGGELGSLFAGPFNSVEWSDPLYIAGAAVRLLRRTPDGLGCSIVFGSTPGFLTVPDVELGDMATALNECATWPPTSASSQNNYGNGSPWTPTVFDTQGTTLPNLNGQCLFTRTGPWGEGTPAPAAGDIMQLQCEFFSTIPIGERPIFEVAVPTLPASAPIANGYFTCTWNLTNIGGDILDGTRFRWNRVSGGDRFSCQYEGAPMVAPTTVRIDCVVTYIVDAV